MPTKRKLRVFLCHSTQDKTDVRDLYKRLDLITWVDPWLDEEKLLPGQNWDLEIGNAVEESDVVVVCCSNESMIKEGYLQRELKYVLDVALEKPEDSIFIIPLRLNDCELPRRLKSWQYADYFPQDQRDKAFNLLMLSLKYRAKYLDIDVLDTQQLHLSLDSTFRVDSKPRYAVTRFGQRAYFEDTSSDKVIYLPSKQNFIIGRLDEKSDSTPDIDLGEWDEGGYVSRKHSEMIFRNGRYYLQSTNNSKNGTFVNGTKVGNEMQEVKDGDEVRFAGVKFRFRYKPHTFT